MKLVDASAERSYHDPSQDRPGIRARAAGLVTKALSGNRSSKPETHEEVSADREREKLTREAKRLTAWAHRQGLKEGRPLRSGPNDTVEFTYKVEEDEEHLHDTDNTRTHTSWDIRFTDSPKRIQLTLVGQEYETQDLNGLPARAWRVELGPIRYTDESGVPFLDDRRLPEDERLAAYEDTRRIMSTIMGSDDVADYVLGGPHSPTTAHNDAA